jgi:hypothetical protein
MTRILVWVWICLAPCVSRAAEPWPDILRQMPLRTNVAQLTQGNCINVMLRAFQSNNTVKALIFMPGATDEFFLFHRARADLTNASPTMLDAVCALTNQTHIRATFLPPLLLLHTDEDPLAPLIDIHDQPTADRLKQAHFVHYVCYNDRDWDYVQPVIRWTLKVSVRPWQYRYDSWHFYRHTFAGWNLTGWEALEAIALAGKTRFAVERKELIFSGDTRVRARPELRGFVP